MAEAGMAARYAQQVESNKSSTPSSVTKYEELLGHVTANPEDDAARIAFAAHIRPSEPERAQFIELQLQEAALRRAMRGRVATNMHPLLAKHEAEWTRTIAKYAKEWKFDRGFVTKLRIDPHLFLEYGEWLFINAPIRAVEFVPPEEGAFPMAEIAASPLLDHLDALTFLVPTLTEADFERLTASPHLSRALYVTTSELAVTAGVYEAFASAPLCRKMLRVLFSLHGFPGDSLEETDRVDMWGAWLMEWTGLKNEGHALEKRYGYIPWLHPNENRSEAFDAAYYVAQGVDGRLIPSRFDADVDRHVRRGVEERAASMYRGDAHADRWTSGSSSI